MRFYLLQLENLTSGIGILILQSWKSSFLFAKLIITSFYVAVEKSRLKSIFENALLRSNGGIFCYVNFGDLIRCKILLTPFSHTGKNMMPNLSTTDSPVIYTIGHSNVPLETLLALLKQFKIQTLVDVRSQPYSRYVPQYNREPLAKSLADAGIEYRFAGDYLGGRPKDPTCYKHGKLPNKKTDYIHEVDYPAVMKKDFFQKGIHQLLKIAATSRTAILCSEENPASCHRHHLIGRYLVGLGVDVLHIRHDGALIPDQQLPNLDDEPKPGQLLLDG